MTGSARAALGLLLGVFLLLTIACARDETEGRQVELAAVDTLLAELGGVPTAGMERAQRWRMISSIGAGLPPANFVPENLPERDARGATILAAYCVQCHWLPAPQMHTAVEWPLLVRRMHMRSRTLRARMGGPHTSELVGQILLSGMATTQLPSAEDTDSLVVYLQRNALPAAGPEEPADTPGGRMFEQVCRTCHELPAPAAHTPDEWSGIVARMRANMLAMDVPPITDDEYEQIVAYLHERTVR
jgi:cytochrome c5